jgi:metal-responsive CopG/Arc/MetJ family transcriptional regulator
MKAISVTLSEDILKRLARVSLKGESRSQTLERLVQDALAARERRATDREELARINRHAKRLNAEALDVLEYQREL